MPSAFTDIIHGLNTLTPDQLRTVIAAAQALLADQRVSEKANQRENEAANGGIETGGENHRMAKGYWLELKMIRGYGPYLYRRWYDGKTKRSQYVGKVKPGGEI